MKQSKTTTNNSNEKVKSTPVKKTARKHCSLFS